MPQLNVRFTGLCLFAPERNDPNVPHPPRVDHVDVFLVDALTPIHKSKPGFADQECGAHVQHVPRIIFNPNDVEDFEVLNPESGLWHIGVGRRLDKLSWLLTLIENNHQVVRLFDGGQQIAGEVELLGEGDPNNYPVPTTEDMSHYFRWIPDVHRIFPVLEIPTPDCPDAPGEDDLPDHVLAKLRLRGGTLGSEDVLRQSVGGQMEPRPFIFKYIERTPLHRQAIATAGLYTVNLGDRLVLEAKAPGNPNPFLRLRFLAQPLTITISNDPFVFMESDPPDDADFELSYLPMRNVAQPYVVPEDAGVLSTKPCSCSSC